jgi:hypothetical protein
VSFRGVPVFDGIFFLELSQVVKIDRSSKWSPTVLMLGSERSFSTVANTDGDGRFAFTQEARSPRDLSRSVSSTNATLVSRIADALDEPRRLHTLQHFDLKVL